jgi:hypothetical protein
MDKVLVLFLALALALSLAIVWLYPLPTAIEVCNDQVKKYANFNKRSTNKQFLQADSAPVNTKKPDTVHSENEDTGHKKEQSGHAVVKELLEHHVPNPGAIESFTYEKFCSLYDIYHKHKDQWGLNEHHLQKICLHHVKEWRFDHKLKLGSKLKSYMNEYKKSH